MLDTLIALPASFWVVALLLLGGGYWAFLRRFDGTGLPMLAVLGTTAAWYVGDAFYNNYADNHVKLFSSDTLQGAWWQVAWFLVVFLFATPEIHRWVNARQSARHSGVMQMFNQGIGDPTVQTQLKKIFWGCVWIWSLLAVIALILLKQDIPYYFFPFLGYKASPWTHGRMGAGLDALSVIAIYLQLLAASLFGVVAALTMDRRIRWFALTFCLLAWPFFIFDRTRNMMLALVVPAILSWVFLRMRGGLVKKGLVLLACFLVINTWMKFVIAHRSSMSITAAFKEKGLSEQREVHNEGLNMFEELCWISTFIDNGNYHVNWGARYFAELVNPIPRGLWPGKPLIGIDYAIARGHRQEDDTQGGVNTTISTGMIGQGVVNFGRFFGPLVAALLMSLWVAWLARLDLTIQSLGHLPLYSLGLILTFNLGRDITLITLYPFIFGALAIWWWNRQHPTAARPASAPGTSRMTDVKKSPARTSFVRRPSVGGFAKRSPAKKPAANPHQIP